MPTVTSPAVTEVKEGGMFFEGIHCDKGIIGFFSTLIIQTRLIYISMKQRRRLVSVIREHSSLTDVIMLQGSNVVRCPYLHFVSNLIPNKICFDRIFMLHKLTLFLVFLSKASGAMIALIVVGVILAVALPIGLVICCFHKKNASGRGSFQNFTD